MTDVEKYKVTWAEDELELEKQLNLQAWFGSYRLVNVLWRPAHEERSGQKRTPRFISIWERHLEGESGSHPPR